MIVCFGDSNTYGHDHRTGGRFAKDIRWPGVLAAELAGIADVVEEGLNGRTTLCPDPSVERRSPPLPASLEAKAATSTAASAPHMVRA